MAVSGASVGGGNLSDGLGSGGGGGGAIPTGDIRNYTTITQVMTNVGTPPFGMQFGDSGNKLYIADAGGDRVSEFPLSTAYDPSTAGAASHFSVSAQETTIGGVAFKPDGLKMFICGQAGDDVNVYTLSVAWDVTSATFDSVAQSVVTNSANPISLSFKPDGTKMFVADASGGDNVDEYALSVAWDVTSLTYTDSVGLTGVTSCNGHAFNSDGTILYIVDHGLDAIGQFNLTDAYDLSTGTEQLYMTRTVSVGNVMGGIAVNDTDTVLYFGDTVNDDVFSLT